MKIAVIGLGSIGKRHIKNLLTIGEKDILAFDPSQEKRKEVEKLGVKTTNNYDDSIKNKNIVFVCSPTRFHISQAIDAAKNNCHIFLEKPVSDSLEGLEELKRLVKEKKLIVQVGFNFRFHPKYQMILKKIPKLGGVVSTRARFAAYLPDWHPLEDYASSYSAKKQLGGGVILDSCHEIDYITAAIGRVKEVVSLNGKHSSLDISTEDTAHILLQHSDKVTSYVHLSYIEKPRDRGWTITGNKGKISWDIVNDTLKINQHNGEKEEYIQKDSIDQTYIEEIKHFIDCIKNKKQPIVGLEQGIVVLKICLAAKQSQEEKRFISLISEA